MEDPTLDAKAEQFKNKGNDEFKRQNFNQAIDYYNQAIGKYFCLYLTLISCRILSKKPSLLHKQMYCIY